MSDDRPETTPESPSGWWWLSFVDAKLPKGSQFLGVAIVEGADIVSAATTAHQIGCNPGGQVMGISIIKDRLPDDAWRNRLLAKAEALELMAWVKERWLDDA